MSLVARSHPQLFLPFTAVFAPSGVNSSAAWRLIKRNSQRDPVVPGKPCSFLPRYIHHLFSEDGNNGSGWDELIRVMSETVSIKQVKVVIEYRLYVTYKLANTPFNARGSLNARCFSLNVLLI